MVRTFCSDAIREVAPTRICNNVTPPSSRHLAKDDKPFLGQFVDEAKQVGLELLC